jgi:hypothetical protein
MVGLPEYRSLRSVARRTSRGCPRVDTCDQLRRHSGHRPRAGGWRQFNDAPDLLTRRGANASAYALSWPYRPNSLGWAGAMPRDGIAASVYLIRRDVGAATGLNLCRYTPHLSAYPLVRKLPLHLPSTTTDTLEGAPNIPEYRVFGRIGESYNVEVRVDINNPRPGAALLSAAQRAVSAISFPRWPNKDRC